MVLDANGECLPLTRRGAIEAWRFRPEKNRDKECKITVQYHQTQWVIADKKLRSLADIKNNYFEKNWPDFLCGEIYLSNRLK